MTAEEERTRLIGDIARVLGDGPVPDDARAAALTLIGWLARRMPGEPVSVCDLTRCRGYAARHGLGESLNVSGDINGNGDTDGGYLEGSGRESSASRRPSRVPRSVR